MSRDDIADIPDLDAAPPQAIQFERPPRRRSGRWRTVSRGFTAPALALTGLAGEVLAETAKIGSNGCRIVSWPLRLGFPK
jgi:hypothetical protein